MEENNETLDALKEMFEKNKGLKREMGPFSALVNENMSITISADNGWSITYPAYCETWALIMAMMDTWGESEKTSIENFVKGIVFPCSMRLSDVDDEYVYDILCAHEKLTKRVIDAKSKDTEDEEQSGDGN